MARIVSADASGLLLGGDGRWYHQGELATHQGISRFFHKQIRKDEAGAFYLYNRIDVPETGQFLEEHVYFEVEDTAYFVESVAMETGPAMLRARLNTGEESLVDPAGLTQDGRGRLYARLPSGDEAGFGRHAMQQLEPALEMVEGEIAVVLGGRSFPIAPRSVGQPPPSGV